MDCENIKVQEKPEFSDLQIDTFHWLRSNEFMGVSHPCLTS